MVSAPENKGMRYMGRPVEELTKEELLEALYYLSRSHENMRKMHEDYVRFSSEIRELMR